MGVENLERASLFRVHDHVLYLSDCSFQCSHLSQSQVVAILSVLLFENHRKHPLQPQGSNLLRVFTRETRSLASINVLVAFFMSDEAFLNSVTA